MLRITRAQMDEILGAPELLKPCMRGQITVTGEYEPLPGSPRKCLAIIGATPQQEEALVAGIMAAAPAAPAADTRHWLTWGAGERTVWFPAITVEGC